MLQETPIGLHRRRRARFGTARRTFRCPGTSNSCSAGCFDRLDRAYYSALPATMTVAPPRCATRWAFANRRSARRMHSMSQSVRRRVLVFLLVLATAPRVFAAAQE